MPPQLNRFPSAGHVQSPYHQQFPPHSQSHVTGHQPPLAGGPAYLSANSQLNPFPPTNGGLGGMSSLGNGFNTGMMDGPRLAFQAANFQQQHNQHQHQLSSDYTPSPRTQQNKGRIREVWKHNLHEEMAVLRDLVERYPYVAMVRDPPWAVPLTRSLTTSDRTLNSRA
jgi:CCR4-NOT transcription complex subunit 7/8